MENDVSSDPRWKLEKLALGQMKCGMHIQFLQNCYENNIVPKGLRLKLKLYTGRSSKSSSLQTSIDALLKKVSLDIMQRIIEDQQIYKVELSKEIEETRGKMSDLPEISSDELFDIESEISDKTERQMGQICERHKEKLNVLMNESGNVQPRMSTNEPSTIKLSRRQKKNSKRRTYKPINRDMKEKSSSQNTQNGASASGNGKQKQSSKAAPKNRNARSAENPSTEESKNARSQAAKTYAQAVKEGDSVNMMELSRTLRELTSLVKTVLNKTGDSSKSRTRTSGEGSRKGKFEFRGGKRRF